MTVGVFMMLSKVQVMLLFESVALLAFGVQLAHGELLWKDEFSSRQSLAGWNVQEVENSYNNELQFYTGRKQNVDVRNGRLVLTPRRERYNMWNGLWHIDHLEGGAAEVEQNSFTFPDMGQSNTLLLGFIQNLLGNTVEYSDSVFGGWPRSGEIDIIEARGQYMDKIQSTIHFQGSETSGDLSVDCSIDRWHLYEMVWSPTEMVFILDGKRYHSFNLDKSFGSIFKKKGQPFDQYFYLILNVAVGGHYVEDPRSNTVWMYPDAEMWVDYARVYSDMNIPSGGSLGGRCPCKAKKASSYDGVCAGATWACNNQKAADVTPQCTARLRYCCNGKTCTVDEVRGLASAVYDSYDSQLLADHSCNFEGTAERKCDSPGPTKSSSSLRCLIKNEATKDRICASVHWACGPGNTYADVSPQCKSGQDTLNCCNADPWFCIDGPLRQAAGAVFQAYYEAIPIPSSCDFGGVCYLAKVRVARSAGLQCVDGYGA